MNRIVIEFDNEGRSAIITGPDGTITMLRDWEATWNREPVEDTEAEDKAMDGYRRFKLGPKAEFSISGTVEPAED